VEGGVHFDPSAQVAQAKDCRGGKASDEHEANEFTGALADS